MSKPKKKVTYEAAMNKAWEDLIARDPIEVSEKSGAKYDSKKTVFILLFLGEEYHITPSKRTVKNPEDQDVYPFMAVLLLHYLAYSKDVKPEGKLISFRELEGGEVYYSAFCARAVNRITDAFGPNPRTLRYVGERIRAKEGGHGDFSIILDVFPKIPVTVILWEGDDEVPPYSNMLFDVSIKEILPTEDVAVIGGFVASALIKALKTY
ncbi:MAG: DUF3786 domain-containing protein [Methanomassiliicoccales archaeon]|nr:MAG: DUF3786 domain-containing protein [Methanomassiliicoccales archaeon]